MPNATLASTTRILHTDRASPELRRYARDEWGSQVHWIRASSRPISFQSRLWRWIDRRRLRTGSPPDAAQPVPPPTPAATVRIERDTSCLHPAREDLGLGGTAVFLRCCLCGEVWVVSGSRAWGLARADPADSAEASCG